MHGSPATERFARLFLEPDSLVALDEAALLIAAHAYPDLDVDVYLRRIDELAAGCTRPTLDGLVRYVFGELGFRGNRQAYYDPRNSYLNDVLDRRMGIPITLAVVAQAIGRRVGVPLEGVNLPGHFVLRDKVDPGVYLDAFDGVLIDQAGCEARYRATHGPEAQFAPGFLHPVGHAAIIGRMLGNLKRLHRTRRDLATFVWILQLRTLVPGVPREERRELAAALVTAGRIDLAATELELLATEVDQGATAAGYRAEAIRLRARLN